MDELFVGTLVVSMWAGGLFLAAVMAWRDRHGDRRLAADVSAALSSPANIRI